MRRIMILGAFIPYSRIVGARDGPAEKAQHPRNLADYMGWYNLSAYNMGVVGCKTPNIERIAKGALSPTGMDRQSCTAECSAFVTGQSPIRTGLTKVGLPGADLGLKKKDRTIAELLTPLGCATGEFGKNHLGAFIFAVDLAADYPAKVTRLSESM